MEKYAWILGAEGRRMIVIVDNDFKPRRVFCPLADVIKFRFTNV